MSKRNRGQAKGRAGDKPARAAGRVRWASAVLVAPLILCVLAAGAASLRWGNVRRAIGLAPLAEPQTTPTPLPLAKEYIYAGGRLVATEEPSAPSGPPPTGLAATTSTALVNQIDLRWDQPATGTVDHYEVGRKSLVGDQFGVVGSTQGAATTFADTGAPDTAYLYAVRAVFAGGGRSAYSNADLATTVAFTDDPLIGFNDPQGRPATMIKAVHLTELRRAVSAVHALAGQGAVTTWTYPNPVSAPPEQRRLIRLEDIQNLRDRLDEALPPLGRTPPTYDGLTRYVTKVSKEHFQQLRDAVK